LSNKLNFEDSLKRLEEITSKLETGDISLDESLKVFEEGIRLSRFCESKLTDIERKIEILKSTDLPDEDVFSENKKDLEDTDEYSKDKKKKSKKIKPQEPINEDENLLFS